MNNCLYTIVTHKLKIPSAHLSTFGFANEKANTQKTKRAKIFPSQNLQNSKT
jgi:hypothetical protein